MGGSHHDGVMIDIFFIYLALTLVPGLDGEETTIMTFCSVLQWWTRPSNQWNLRITICHVLGWVV